MALPDALLGTSLKSYFNTNYTASTGTFVDDKGVAANLTQATSGNRPTWNVTTAPSGRGLLSFPGTNNILLSGGAIPTGSLPAYSGSGFWVEFFIFKRGTPLVNIDERMFDYNGDYVYMNFEQLIRFNAQSDSNSLDSTTYRAIFVHNVSSGVVTMYLNGTAQATTGTTNTTIRTEWTGSRTVGNRSNGLVPFKGLIGCIGYAVQSTWTTTDTANLDAAMNEWWTTAPGGGGTSYSLTSATLSIPFSGKTVGLLKAPKLAVSTASIPFAGKTVALSIGRRITATTTAIPFAANAVGLVKAQKLAASTASIPFAATGVSLSIQRKLSVAQASIPVAASTVGLTVQRRLSVASSAIPFSAGAVGLLKAQRVAVSTASIAFAGQSAFLDRGYRVVASTATIPFSAPIIGLTVQRKLSVTTTSLSFTAPAVGLRAARKLAGATTAIPFGAGTVSFSYVPAGSFALPVSSLAIPFSGGIVGLRKAVRATVATSAIAFTGQTVRLLHGYGVVVSPLAIAFNAQSVQGHRGPKLAVSTLPISFGGQTVALRHGYTLTASSLAIPFAGQSVGKLRSSVLSVSTSALAITSYPVALSVRGGDPNAASALIEWTSSPATLIDLAQLAAVAIDVSQLAAVTIDLSQGPATSISAEYRMSLYVGDQNNLTFTFKNPVTLQPLDPSAVWFAVKGPGDTTATIYTYGTDSNVTKIATGQYLCAVDCDRAGRWTFTAHSPGPIGKGTKIGEFYVEPVLQ